MEPLQRGRRQQVSCIREAVLSPALMERERLKTSSLKKAQRSDQHTSIKSCPEWNISHFLEGTFGIFSPGDADRLPGASVLSWTGC